MRYFNMLASQQKNKADSLERADLLLSDLALETELCLKICADNNNRERKITDIDESYYNSRKFTDLNVSIDLEDQKARDAESLLTQIIMEFYSGIPTIAIRQQNKNIARKVPDEIKALVEKVLKEIEKSPKQHQAGYEREFNIILMAILNNASDAKEQSECKVQLIALSKEVVQKIHAQNEHMAKKVPEGKKALVERVMKEIEHSPKQNQSQYELSFNSILIDILSKAADANKQSECQSQFVKLSQKIVYDIHHENVITLEAIGGENLSSAPDLKKSFSIISERPAEQQSECAIKLKELLTKASNSADDYKLKKKEIDRAIASEKSKRFLRRVAIVSAGIVAAVGLAALTFFRFGAALSHAFFLGGLGVTATIKASDSNDQKSDEKLQQLRLEKQDLIRKHEEVIAGVSKEYTEFVASLDKYTDTKESSPQTDKRNSLTMFSQGKKIVDPLNSNYSGLRQR